MMRALSSGVRPAVSRAALAAAALAAATLLGACGGHGALQAGTVTHTVGAPNTPAPRTATPQAQPLTAARAQAFASAVNLRAQDVPGFAPSQRHGEHESAAEKRLQARLSACLGEHVATGGGAEQSSPQFTHAGVLNESVSSSVSFLASATVAQRELGLLRSARAHRCLAAYLQALFAGRRYGNVVVRRVTVSQGVPPAPGTAGGYAWRIRADVGVHALTAPYYLDILGFVYGQAEVRLLSTGLVVPFPAAAEEHLYQLLISRAIAHHP